MKRTTSLALAALLAATSLGCYGQFALTRKIYDWNGHATSNKAANSAITWALVIIPVYGVCGLADFLIFNTIEFYSGKNPISVDEQGNARVKVAGREYQLSPAGDGQVEVRSADGPTIRYRIDGDRATITDAAGRVLKTIYLSGALASSGPVRVY